MVISTEVDPLLSSLNAISHEQNRSFPNTTNRLPSSVHFNPSAFSCTNSLSSDPATADRDKFAADEERPLLAFCDLKEGFFVFALLSAGAGAILRAGKSAHEDRVGVQK